ncbi:MAG: XdhC family protein [Cyclobacteriaceae bacterium]|nr:XdhC family protein [Cyclobacteriaceae bacterium]
MTHEFLKILESYKKAAKNRIRTVLATIVHVEGSSYRKEGTQMLIDENHQLTGALSGGCIEKEVTRQAASVFSSTTSKVFKYDGRYRLGCEGSIYILLELFEPSDELLVAIENAIEKRTGFSIACSFLPQEISKQSFGTTFEFNKKSFFHTHYKQDLGNLIYRYLYKPLDRLYIFGVEHDAKKLSEIASFLGWEVIILATEQCDCNGREFPFAKAVQVISLDNFDLSLISKNSALVVMSHNYAKDLRFLLQVIAANISYIGILGPVHRREKLLHDIIETNFMIDEEIFNKIHGPVGLPIGGETPEEIALSIMAEIVSDFKLKNRIENSVSIGSNRS